jgi:hypothetical protein
MNISVSPFLGTIFILKMKNYIIAMVRMKKQVGHNMNVGKRNNEANQIRTFEPVEISVNYFPHLLQNCFLYTQKLAHS